MLAQREVGWEEWQRNGFYQRPVLSDTTLRAVKAAFRSVAGTRDVCNLSNLVEQLLDKQQTWVPDTDDAARVRVLLRALDGPEIGNIWLSWDELVARLEEACGAVFDREHGLLLPKAAMPLLARTRLKPELEAARAAISRLSLTASGHAASSAAASSGLQLARNGKGPPAAELGQYRSLLATARADEYSLPPHVRQPPPLSSAERSARLEADLWEATRQLERCRLDRKHAEQERKKQLFSGIEMGSSSASAATAAAAATATAAGESSASDRGARASDEALGVRGMTGREISDVVELRMQMEHLKLKRAEEEMAKAASERQQLLARRRQPLPPQHSAMVDAAMRGNKNEVLFTLFNASITREKFRCLQPLTWLNDEVINLYVQLLAKRDEDRCAADKTRLRSHFFSSFFLEKLDGQGGYNYAGVRRWTRKAKVDVFALDKVFVPVNISNMHWCMAVIYIRRKKVCYFDSMGGAGRRCCESLLRWLEDESKDKKGPEGGISTDDWEAVPTPRGTPQQENGCDCGVFSIAFCDYLSDDLPLAFSQDDMPAMRQRIAYSLLEGRYIE